MDNYKDIIFRDSLDGLYLDGTGKWSLPPTSSFGMIYPSAGIALSTGSAWGTSIADNHVNWDSAYTHSQVVSGNPHSVAWSELTGSRSSITLSGFDKDLVLGDSTDVIIGTPSAGEALIYTSGAWRNATVPAPSSLKEIGDVYASMSPSDGEALMWDGANSRWDAGAIGNSHRLLAHSDVSQNTIATSQIIVNTSDVDFSWKNIGIEIPGAGTTGLNGGYFSYNSGPPERLTLDLAVNFAGDGTASTVARSDHSHYLDNLTDVNVTGVTKNQVIVYNDVTNNWEPIYYTLSGLSDTNFSTLGDGNLIAWDNTNSEWHNITPGSLPDIYITDIEFTTYQWPTANIIRNGSTPITADFSHGIKNHSGTSIASPTNGQYLGYDGANWVNSTPPDTNYYLSAVNAADMGAVVFTMTGTSNITADFSHKIKEHSDVAFTGGTGSPPDPKVDDIMKWSGTAWVNVPIPVTNTYTGSAPIDVTGTTISLLYDSLAGALQLIGNKLAVKLGTSADTAAYGDHGHTEYLLTAGDSMGGTLTFPDNINLDFGDSTLGARVYSDGTYLNVTRGIATTGLRFYIRSTIPTTYIYSPLIYLGSTSGTSIYLRGNHMFGDSWDIATNGTITSGATSSATYTQMNAGGYFDVRVDNVTGGWARGLRAMNSSTRLMEIGYLGSGTSVTYAFIGKANNDTSARFYPDGAAQLYYNGSLKIATTSTGATLNSSPIVNEAHRDFDKTWQSLSWSNSGTTTWNVSNGYNAYITVGTAGTSLSISNLEDGDYGVLFITCGASSQTITFPTGTKQAGAGGNTVSTSAGSTKVDIISFVYKGTSLYITVGKDFS